MNKYVALHKGFVTPTKEIGEATAIAATCPFITGIRVYEAMAM